ncbi:hypothetical protein ACSNOI_38975 [Actinomadura kijaniata]|uniref:hypothetical protein n=1 Tax=Actinomadura kijaniata TaxID=46161 RepID=UPI003F197D93
MSSFRSLLVVDAERFTANPDAELPGVHLEIRRALAAACERSGLGETWENARFRQSTGDGMLAVLPLEAMIPLIGAFGDRLQEELAKASRRLRLRVALHVGLVDDEHPVTAGIATATNDVSRLVDCGPLREALAQSDPGVTFTAVLVSEQAFDMFVRGGHTGLKPSQFTRVRAKVKQFDKHAYLYVPKPSWREEDETPSDDGTGGEGGGGNGGGGGPAAPPPGGTSISNLKISGRNAQNVIGSTVNGGVHRGRS